ncbi:MAG: SRPBCC family protein [bacterium]
MFRFSYFIMGVALIFSSQSGFTQTQNQPITGQSFSAEITINAAPARVWEILTDAGQLTGLLGYEFGGGAKTFAKVGDEAQVKVWGDAGSFTLIRANPGKELRFSLDPENGSYICSCRWVLSKSGTGTKLWFGERYTESGPQTKEDLEAQVKDSNERLRKLKLQAEKK